MFNVEMFCVVDQKLKENLSKEFSDLVIYCKNVHFNSFENSQTHSKPYEMSSFSESKARKLIKEAGRFLKKYIRFVTATVLLYRKNILLIIQLN